MLDLYKGLDIYESFKNFISKSTSSTTKRFSFIVDGLTKKQYDELFTYIQQTYKRQILEFYTSQPT